MRILQATQIREKDDKKAIEVQSRITRLNEAESNATRSLNKAKEFSGENIELLNQQLEEHESMVRLKKIELSKEVAALEERKKEALAPIKEQVKEAEELLSKAKDKENQVDARDVKLRHESEQLVERTEQLVSIREEIKIEEGEYEKRKIVVSKAEEVSEKSVKELNAKWVKFHDEVSSANSDLSRREKEVNYEHIANDAIRSRLEDKSKEQDKKEIELQDRYKTLEKSIQRFNKDKDGRSKKR